MNVFLSLLKYNPSISWCARDMAKVQGSWAPKAPTPPSRTHSQISCTSNDTYYTTPELESCGSTGLVQRELEFKSRYFTPRECCTPVSKTPNLEDNDAAGATVSDLYSFLLPTTDGACLCQACVPLSPHSTSTNPSHSLSTPCEIGLFEQELAEALIWVWHWPGSEPIDLDDFEWYPDVFSPAHG